MATLSRTRFEENVEPEGLVSSTALLGTWSNTNSATHGITRAVLTEKDGQVFLRVFGETDAEHPEWGETVASVFAGDSLSAEAMAFSAFYDFGFMETLLQGHVRQGVLIIAKFERFKDNSGRSSYFSKEFFYRGQ
jgi:hypothetical protein